VSFRGAYAPLAELDGLYALVARARESHPRRDKTPFTPLLCSLGAKAVSSEAPYKN